MRECTLTGASPPRIVSFALIAASFRWARTRGDESYTLAGVRTLMGASPPRIVAALLFELLETYARVRSLFGGDIGASSAISLGINGGAFALPRSRLPRMGVRGRIAAALLPQLRRTYPPVRSLSGGDIGASSAMALGITGGAFFLPRSRLPGMGVRGLLDDDASATMMMHLPR